MKKSNIYLEIRTRLNMSQQQFATMLEVWPTNVSYWERGKTKPNVKQLKKLVAYLNKHDIGISTDELIKNL